MTKTDKDNSNADEGSKSLSIDSAANTTDKVTRFWEKYSKEAGEHDEDFQLKNGKTIEGVMLFAGLFSAVSASFLVNMQADLKPNPTDTTNALLKMLVHSANSTAFSNQDLGIPTWNGPSSAMVCSQVLGYAALSASLLAALGAVLGKQWLTDFTRLRSGPLQERSRRRQQKLDGLKTWHFGVFMGTLPALIQLALLLFSISLAIYLWELNHGVALVVIAATGIGVLFYIFITLAALFSPTCPFRTPVSSTIRGFIGFIMKSVEEVAEYWAWRADRHHQKRPMVSRGNRMLAYMAAVIFSPLLAVASIIFLMMIAILSPVLGFVAWVRRCGVDRETKSKAYHSAFRFTTLGRRFHAFICWVRDSARRARDSMRMVYLDPAPHSTTSDPLSIAWLLETSTDPDSLMAAAELVPDVEWPIHLDISLPAEHLYSIFIRSIPERGPTDNRALRLGKAFIIMLCQMSKEVSTHVWKSALRCVIKESRNLKPGGDPDLLFILTIVAKLLSHKSGSTVYGVEFPNNCVVSQELLAWFLQPLEALLQMEHPHQSRFLPEAYRAFLMLEWPEAEMEELQEMQYCRTFEIYFNSVVGAHVEEMDKFDENNAQEPQKVQADRLKRVLGKLKQVDLDRFNDIYGPLIVPLTVLSKLASIPHFKQSFEDACINSWMLRAFKEAVARAICAEDATAAGQIWLFASCLMKLATAVDAFHPIELKVENSRRSGDGHSQTPVPPLRMDSKSLLSYLLNKATPATSEQAAYALRIMLANVDELPELAFYPDFIDYILYATSAKQVYSVRDVGLQVLVAACQSLLSAHDLQGLVTLAAECDLVHFLRRAILSEEPPTLLKNLVQNNDEEFNATLLSILAPTLGDPFNDLLTKLQEEPNKIPERDLGDLEIALVLSNEEGRKKFLYDQLDKCIGLIPLQGYTYALELPLTVFVGRLLRADGPLSRSDDVRKALSQHFEGLLSSAWGEPDTLEDNPQMLRLLLDCTIQWLTTHEDSGTGSSSRSPSPGTLAQLDSAVDQLRGRSRALSSDIKRALSTLTRKIRQHALE